MRFLLSFIFPVCVVLVGNQSIQTPAASPKGWQYEKTVDMSGAALYKATLASENSPQFPYPFGGGSVVMLAIRTRNGSTNAYLEVSKGLFNHGFQSGKATIRFNAKPPVTYTLTAAANGRANIVFFDTEQRLIRQIKESKTMIVQVAFAGQPLIEARYKSAGLQWKQ
ncbi:MAG: hypothetical protein LH609_10205 [Rudanella sp.]|nr:hypothetical protein [Rudanella sp.]